MSTIEKAQPSTRALLQDGARRFPTGVATSMAAFDETGFPGPPGDDGQDPYDGNSTDGEEQPVLAHPENSLGIPRVPAAAF